MVMKWLSVSLLAGALLQAKDVSSDELSGIYTEAILFVSVFAVMGVVSFVISRKHARNYVKEPASAKEEVPLSDAEKRVIELSKLVKSGLLREDEFEILKRAKKAP